MTQTHTTNTNYPQPSPEFIEDLRKRIADANVPDDVLERVHRALTRDPIQNAATILYKAGLCLSSAELCEYRKTLFPPNGLLDPLTHDVPELRNCDVAEPASSQAEAASASPSIGGSPHPEPASESNPEPAPAQQLDEARQSLVNVLSAHANQTSTAMSVSVPPCINGEGVSCSGASLLSDLRDLIKRYVVLPDLAAETLALWVVHTYAFTLREITTYIGVVSPEKRCGKTTLLELLGHLAHQAIAAANISPSALFRVIEQKQPTLIIDEADTFLHGRDEMAGILNAGYRKGNAYVMRVAEGNQRKKDLAKYSCWCPKVMAAIGRLPDTLADRCIGITMQRKLAADKCERLRDLDATAYQQRCAAFVEQHRHEIAAARPKIAPNLNDRAADIWEPLFAIADIAGGGWDELARQAAQQLSGQDDELTPLSYFLKDLRTWMVINKWDRVLSRDIVSSFNPVHNRPWEDLRRGREINEWWLGRHLRALGVFPKYLRNEKSVARGYTLDDIECAYRRYVPDPKPIETSNATADSSPTG